MTVDLLGRLRHQYKPLLIGMVMGSILLWPRVTFSQMRVSPLVIETQARRGQAQGVVSVTNVADTVLRARVYAEPFTYTDAGIQFLAPGQSTGDLTPYLQFSPTELVVPPGATRRIRLITRFPPSLPEGEYRAIIFTERLPEPGETPSSGESEQEPSGNEGSGDGPLLQIKVRIGSTFYVRQGNVTPNLSVLGAGWNLNQQALQLLVENTGLASERAGVDWQLKQGETLISRGVTPAATVIAQTQRHLQLKPDKAASTPLPAGDYQLTGEVLWEEGGRPQRLRFDTTVTIPAVATP